MTQVSPVLVAREELLVELVGLAGLSGPHLAVLTGASGSGRTLVLDELARRLAAEEPPYRVLRAGGAAWEAEQPYGVLRQLLPGLDPAPRLDAFAAGAAVAAASAAAEPEVLVLLVDDAHHTDPASLQALATAVRHHHDLALLVVLARASGDPRGTADQVLDRIGDLRRELAPFTPAEVGELASRLGVPLHPALAEHLARHTVGVPRHLVALLRSLPRDTWTGTAPALPAPDDVAHRVRTALDGCGAQSQALVEAVAVLHAPVDVRVASAVAGLTDPVPAVDEAERHRLLALRERAGSLVLELPDPMVRAAVRAAMGGVRRSTLHRRAAEVVEDPAEALAHAVEASPLPDPDLADRLEALAGERAARGEWASAAELFGLAARATDSPREREARLVRAVDALVGAGDVPSAASYIAEIESLRETPMRNAVLGYLAILRGRPQEAEARLARAWQLVRSDREPDVAATVCHRQVLHHLARCDGAGLVRWADRAVELVGADQPTAVEAQAIRGLGLGGTGRTDEALQSYRDLWGHASRGAVGQRVQMGAGWLHLATDQLDLARAELETAVPTDFLGGSTRISLWARAWLARTCFVTGEWDVALRVVDAATELADRTGTALVVPLLQWTATQVHALRGDWSAAAESARRGEAGARDYEIMRVPDCLARAAAAEARADYAGVLRALAPLTEPWAAGDVAEPGFWPWPDVYANALVLEGRLAEADAFLVGHEQRAADRDHASARARLGYARGRWHGAHGDLPAARRCFEEALLLLEPLPLVYDRARVGFAYGQTLRRAGKRREADEVISVAREGYLSLGATTYVLRCERELRAGGVRAVLKDRPAHALTPQEEAVAGLVATGRSNREVASELFLSVKTVQFHLTRVYAKLGIRSRTELAAARSGGAGVEEDA